MSLKKLISPESIAIVGVSDKPGFGRSVCLNALSSRDTGRLYFVNPKREELFGQKCYPSISELPEAVDCVVIATAAHTVAGLLEESGRLGAGAAIVFASGFAEEGSDEGDRLEQEVIETARKYGMKVQGPNCFGMMNNVDKINLWAGHTHWDPDDDAHGIAVIAQSGFVAAEIINTGFMNISYAISTGNGNIVSLEECMEYTVEDDNVSVVALYLEGVRDAARFTAALGRAAELRKPVVVMKAGRSEKGAISAASHTGSLAGSGKAYDSVFKKYGVIPAYNLEEFVCLSQTMSVLGGNFPESPNLFALSFSGGETTLTADLAEDFGLELPDISDAAKEEIQKYIPSFAAAKNPLDATTALFRDEEKTIGILRALQAEESIGAITIGTNVSQTEDATTAALCRAIAAAKETDAVSKPIFAIPSFEGSRHQGSRRILEDAGVPLMSSMATSFGCLKRITAFSGYDWKARTLKPCVGNGKGGMEAKALSEFDSKNELKKYGIPVPAQAIVRSAGELTEAAAGMKYPLALKINSDEILHKTDAGCVALNVKDADEAKTAYLQIIENAGKNAPGTRTDGVLVQEMAPAGVEIIIGASNDAQFGPMVLVGLGGVFVELFKDTALYPAPLNSGEALELLKSLKGYRLLTGFRGSKPCDIQALADTIVRIGDYAYGHRDEVKEMDLNPVFVYPEGEGVCAVDALIVKW
ncbi:MAG: acetate--CoA ligase family protein [Clostridiales Family XIII bacterium]|jgi:acyl-CoA synthetase (NDP forming)|nr:acetate--CoA ligase family protein [Clostridiales Family XIII bacterium]